MFFLLFLISQSLTDLEIAAKVMKKGNDSKEDPIDSQYRSLKCEMETVKRDSEEFEILKDYVKNTHAPTHTDYSLEVMDIFKLNKCVCLNKKLLTCFLKRGS